MNEMSDTPANESAGDGAGADGAPPEAEIEAPSDVESQPCAEGAAHKGRQAPDEDSENMSKKSRKAGKKEVQDEAVEARLLRLQADFDNFRKRTLREKKDLYTRANEDIVLELLPVLDHMELALDAAREHAAPQALLDGFGLVLEQLITVLKKFNLSVIDAEASAFDPNLHEAISHIGSPDVEEGGIITQVRKGYMLGDQLLRPAQVVVSSGPPNDIQPDLTRG